MKPVLLILFGLLLVVDAVAAQPPNVLWISIEDQHPWFRTYGETKVTTPNIDALEAQGVVFERAFAAVPVCSPSRSAIITGVYPIRAGTHNQRSGRVPYNQIRLPEGMLTVPELFRRVGYSTFNNGKDDYNFTYDRADLYSIGNPENTRMPFEGDPRMMSLGWKGPRGRGDWQDVPKGVPFFGQIGSNGGKGLRLVPAALEKAGLQPIDPADVDVPPQYPDIPGIRAAVAGHLDTMVVTDNQVGEIVGRMQAEGVWENTIIFIYSDHGSNLPRSKEFCYEEGLHVPLIVVAPGMQDVVKPGTRRGDIVNLMDVAATSLALAGIAVPDTMDSRNVFAKDYHREYVFSSQDQMANTIDRVRSVMGQCFHYIRNFMTDRPLYKYGYREMGALLAAKSSSAGHYLNTMRQMYEDGELTAAQALPYGPRPAEELYDLESDPHELVNLAEDPAYRKQLDEMSGALAGWLADTGDKGQYPLSTAAMREITERFPKDWLRNPEFQSARKHEVEK